MTPQEHQLVSELFDRLAALENAPRDPEADRAVADGLVRAPHAVYALVQSVLVQDEALKRANARIEELEGTAEPQPSGGGFLDTMRAAMLGRESTHGSVPSVRPASFGPGMGSSGRWNMGSREEPYAQPRAYDPPPSTYAAPASGGSFLGTAAASAAGVIGGALLLNSIRGMFGPSHPNMGSGAFDPGLSGGGSPWGGGSAANSDLARDAGLGDIGRGGSDHGSDQRAGLFGGGQDSDDGDDSGSDFGGDGGGGDSDTA